MPSNPSHQYLLKSFYNFLGGLNTDYAPDNLADNELVVAENVDFSERGGIVKRKGCVALNANPFDGQVKRIIEIPQLDSEASYKFLAIIDNELYEVDEQGNTNHLRGLSGGDITYFWCTQEGINYLYFIDNGTMFRYKRYGFIERVEAEPNSQNAFSHIVNCKYAVRHPKSFRFFVAGNPDEPDVLYFSEPNSPNFFKSQSRLYPTSSDGAITGLAIVGDAVAVFFRNSIWIWRGVDPEIDATWEKLPASVGTASSNSISLTTNSLTFHGEGGIYSLSPAVLGYSALALHPDSGLVNNLALGKVETLVREISNPDKTVAVYDVKHQRYMLAYSDTPNSQINDKILVLDWATKSFTIYTGIVVNDLLYTQSGELYAASNNYILKLNEGYTDNGKTIEMKFRTKEFNLDYPFHRKRITKLFSSFKQPQEGNAVLQGVVFVDGEAKYIFDEDTSYGGFTWGESEWGSDVWGYRNQVTVKRRINISGHRIQLEVNNSQHVPIVIYGFGVEFKPIRTTGRSI